MRFNVVFVGSVGGGKTSIIQKHFHNTSSTKHVSTIAVDFIPTVMDDVAMSVWDTCGQERFSAITSSYFMRGHVFVLVHDISESTLNRDIHKWYDSIVNKRPARHEPVIIVVSNKVDLHPFCSDDVTNWVKEHSFEHIYTSAKTGENIERLFEKIRDSILVHQTDWLAPSLPAIPITESTAPIPGCAC
tara:strand:- start:2778 stop:3341 length:564 start_codon:yes stop_codon:yes gene_type:complete